jgi:hypothetical protein
MREEKFPHIRGRVLASEEEFSFSSDAIANPLTANAKVATALGLKPASSDTSGSEGRYRLSSVNKILFKKSEKRIKRAFMRKSPCMYDLELYKQEFLHASKSSCYTP